MPVEVKGKWHKTIEEAAKALGVHPQTLRRYMKKGIVTQSPKVPNGITERPYFPDDLIETQKKQLSEYRKNRKTK